jgi:hypothetical protein
MSTLLGATAIMMTLLLTRPLAAAEPAAASSTPAIPAVFDLPQREVTFQSLPSIDMGTAPVSVVAIVGDWLVLGTQQRSNGQPVNDPRIATDLGAARDSDGRWRSSAGVEAYRIGADGSLTFAGRAIMRLDVRAVQVNEQGRVFAADDLAVTCYQISNAGLVRQWQYEFPQAHQIEVLTHQDRPAGGIVIAGAQRVDIVDDRTGQPARLHSLAISCRRIYQGPNTMLIVGQLGESAVVQFLDLVDRPVQLRTLPLLGRVVDISRSAPQTALALSSDFGLRLLTPGPYMDRRLTPPLDLDLADWQGTQMKREARQKLVVAERPLPQASSYRLARAISPTLGLLVRRDGAVEQVALDAAAMSIGEPHSIVGLSGIVGVAGNEKLAVAWDRAGRVFAIHGGTSRPLLPLREPGPWVRHGQRLLVALGPELCPVDGERVGPAVHRVQQPRIIDAAADADLACLLSDGELEVVQLGDAVKPLARVPVPTDARRVFVGHGRAYVVHGQRRVTSIDLSTPASARVLAQRELELPLHWPVPHKYADQERFIFQIEHMLIEPDRVLVAGGELFIFDAAALAGGQGTLAPRRVIHRIMGSFDDTAMAKRVDRVGPNLYHWNSEHLELARRAYVTQLTDGPGQPPTEPSRAGTSLTRDLLLRDGIAFIAAGRLGLRAVQFDGTQTTLLGAVTVPNAQFEALHFIGDTLHVKNGNEIRRYRVSVSPRRPGTAFTFAPRPGAPLPRVLDGGAQVDSPAYASQRALPGPLQPVAMDLSDQAGWPRVAVPYGRVGIDNTLGRIKFADGRAQPSQFLDKIGTFMWSPSGGRWLKIGPYVAAPAGEIGHGFLVMDLRDPDQPRVVGACGNSPWGAYSNRSIGVKDNIAYIGDNWFRFVIAIDVSDPTRPRYVRSVEIRDGDQPGLIDPQFRGIFKNDRLFVTTTRGLFELDIREVQEMSVVKVHEAVPQLHWIADDDRYAISLDRQAGRLAVVDLADLASVKTLAEIRAGEELGLATLQGMQVQNDRLYVWGARADKSSAMVTYRFAPPAAPQRLGLVPLEGPVSNVRVHDGHILVGRDKLGFEVWRCDGPDSATKLGQLQASDYPGQYQRQFLEDQPHMLDMSHHELFADTQVQIVHLEGRIAWIYPGYAEAGYSTLAVDWSDPARPRLRRGILGPSDEGTDLRVDHERQIAQLCGGATYMIDIANPGKLRTLWGYNRNLSWGAERSLGDIGQFITRTNRGSFLWFDLSRLDRPVVRDTGMIAGYVGPDPSTRLLGAAATLVDAGFLRLESDPITVEPGSVLQLRGTLRPVSRNNASSQVRLTVLAGDPRKPIGGVDAASTRGTLDIVRESKVVIPADTLVIRVQIECRGPVWFADLALRRGSDNLIANPGLDQPIPPQFGRIPGWNMVLSRPGGTGSFHDPLNHRLYLAMGPNLVIYDARTQSPTAIGVVGVEVIAGQDQAQSVIVATRGERLIAFVATQLGIVTVDVSDARRPFRLGACLMPWIRPVALRLVLSGNTLAAAPGYVSFGGTHGLYTLDVSDPTKPRPLAFFQDNVTGLSVQGTRIYANGYVNGGAIFDVSEPANPLVAEETIFNNTNAGAGAMHVVGDHLFRSMAGGMESWRVTLPPQAPAGRITLEFTDTSTSRRNQP